MNYHFQSTQEEISDSIYMSVCNSCFFAMDDCKPSRTSIHMGKFEQRYKKYEEVDENEDVDEANSRVEQHSNMSGFDLREERESNKYKVYRQRAIQSDEFIENLVIKDSISSGGLGKVYHCSYGNKNYVVKIPIRMMKAGLLIITNQKLLRIEAENKKQKQIVKDDQDIFGDEAYFANMALKPSIGSKRIVGMPMPEQSFDAFLKLTKLQREMNQHVGFQHIHQLKHYDPSYPLILSEPCKGSLDRCQVQDVDISDLARDVGRAIMYLNDVAGFFHMDIKTQNIFFKDVNGGFIWILGDFGYCIEVKAEAKYIKRQRHCTSYYNRCKYIEDNQQTHTSAYVVCVLGYIFALVETILKKYDKSVDPKRDFLRNHIFIKDVMDILSDSRRKTLSNINQKEVFPIWEDCQPFLSLVMQQFFADQQYHETLEKKTRKLFERFLKNHVI